MKLLTYKDFELAFGEKLNNYIKSIIKKLTPHLQYSELTQSEKEEVILTILKTLEKPTVKKAGSHRLEDWIKGWGENNEDFCSDKKFLSLIPKYFGKHPYVRWNQKFIKPTNSNFEYSMVQILQYWLFDKYFRNTNNVYEFGCGTGHNLFRVKDINSKASLYGLDWSVSSQNLIKNINEHYKDTVNIQGHKFDFFNINDKFSLKDNSGIFTFAALEQVGNKCQNFIEYLIKQNPSVCLHIEPMGEYLDKNNLNDFLSIKYFEKRNYIKGLRKYLHKLYNEGKIEIIQDQRSNIGSMFVDGYSIIAWKPKTK